MQNKSLPCYLASLCYRDFNMSPEAGRGQQLQKKGTDSEDKYRAQFIEDWVHRVFLGYQSMESPDVFFCQHLIGIQVKWAGLQRCQTYCPNITFRHCC